MPSASWIRPRRTRAGREEQGAAAVEFLLLAPLLLLITLLLIQWAIRLEAQRVVGAAAREGAVATGRWDGSEEIGRQTALDYLTSLDPQLQNRTARASLGRQQATVTVEADVLSLIPGIDLHVASTATVPTERFAEVTDGFTNPEGGSGGN